MWVNAQRDGRPAEYRRGTRAQQFLRWATVATVLMTFIKRLSKHLRMFCHFAKHCTRVDILGLGFGAIRGVRGTPNQTSSDPYQYYTRFLQLEERNTMVDKFWG